ncbi:amino acid permease-domain-containing protein [Aspergillus sergii]|uniref:Amino acid permease-domain-containing protein n=1 Tax=Aspergillus sergii TaxID=1034303 RepID=A0A5N6X043_9EURO|nr:amino acid permease-domain-containing protein [Aspergillus sergii]
MSVLLIIIFGLLAYVNLDASGEIVFAWLQALSCLAALFTWGSICLAHIRFRNAWKFHGHTLDEIPFKAVGGVYGSWLGLSLVILVLIAQFFVAIAPPKGGINDAEGFFQTYLALPVVLFFWIDVDSGRREIDWEPIHAERERLAAIPAWRRLLNIIF